MAESESRPSTDSRGNGATRGFGLTRDAPTAVAAEYFAAFEWEGVAEYGELAAGAFLEQR